MKRFAVSIAIAARPAAVWRLLTDAAGYPAWNSTVERIEGRIAAGERIVLRAKIAPGRAFALTVSELVAPERMTWSGGMPLGLFTGIRRFSLTPLANQEVRFAMEETYGGLLAPLIGRALPDLQPAFDAFAADLKRRAEAAA